MLLRYTVTNEGKYHSYLCSINLERINIVLQEQIYSLKFTFINQGNMICIKENTGKREKMDSNIFNWTIVLVSMVYLF